MAAAILIAGASRVEAELLRAVMGSGGAPCSSAGFVLSGTLGQPTPVGRATGASVVLYAGFWGPTFGSATGVELPGAEVLHTSLRANYPNPFNPATLVAYTLAGPCHVQLVVYDTMGRLIRTLADADEPAGAHTVVWDGTDLGGRRVASGVYFYRLRAGDFNAVRKMTLVK